MRKKYRERSYGQTLSSSGEKIIRFAYEETLWGERQKESSDWSLVMCLKVPGCLCLAEEEKNQHNEPKLPLCLTLFVSLLSLSLLPLFLSPSHPTTLRQLPLCSQINWSPVAFGKCEINKCFASEVFSVFSPTYELYTALDATFIQSIGDSICPPQICCAGFPSQIPHTAPSVTLWPYLLPPCDPSGSKYPIYKSARRVIFQQAVGRHTV